MAGAKRRRHNLGERRPVIGRVRRAGILAPVNIVVVHDNGVVSSFGAVPHHAFTLRAGAARSAGSIAHQHVGRLRLIATVPVRRDGGLRPWYDTTFHQDHGSTQVFLLHQAKGSNLRAINAYGGHLGSSRNGHEDTCDQSQNWKGKVLQCSAYVVGLHFSISFSGSFKNLWILKRNGETAPHVTTSNCR